jgi:E3 ubiquitin-protein ligase TRIP12
MMFKDGVFDHKGYTDKALARMVKAKAKADRAAARQAAFALSQPSPDASAQATPAAEPSQDINMNDFPMQDPDDIPLPASVAEPAVADRTDLLRSKPEVVGRFMQLMVPILIDVYAASVITPVRVKTLTGLLKAVGFLEGEALKNAFNASIFFVPFIAHLILKTACACCEFCLVDLVLQGSSFTGHRRITACRSSPTEASR